MFIIIASSIILLIYIICHGSCNRFQSISSFRLLFGIAAGYCLVLNIVVIVNYMIFMRCFLPTIKKLVVMLVSD